MEENESQQPEYTQEQLSMLLDAYKEASSNYDKHVLYVSTGALVICTSYLNSIIPLKSADNLWLYFIGVISLMIAIILCLIGLYISARAIGELISGDDVVDEVDHNEWINLAVLIFSVLGLALLSIFSIINLVQ